MENRNINLCLGCMRQKGEEEVCPRCGYRFALNPTGEYLQPKTVLKDRYIVGRIISKNSQDVSYIGFDVEIESRVEIREFFPRVMSERADNLNVSPKTGREVLFKTLKSEFSDLYVKLGRLKTLNNIPRVFDVFEENGTVYAVTEKKDLIKFSDYLSFEKDEITAEKLQTMFKPLLLTVATLNEMGILHKRISPENIYLDKYEKMNIGNFEIASLMNTELDMAELEGGYAAPELYLEKAETGNYTEVYSLAAVMYKALTGANPPSASERMSGTYLIAPNKLNPAIPDGVSDLIVKAMELDPAVRIQSVRGLAEMFEAVFSSADKTEKVVAVSPKKEKNSKKTMIIVWSLVGAAIVVLIALICVVLFSGNKGKTPSSGKSDNTSSLLVSDESGDESDTSSENVLESSSDGRYYATIDCVGKKYADIANNQDYLLRFTFEAKYEYSDDYAEGVIIRQDPQPDEPLLYMGTIKVIVSKGPQYYEVPEFKGVKLEDYIATLKEMGFADKNITTAAVDDADAEPGEVVDAFLKSGEMKINIEQVGLTKIVVHYKKETEE